MCKRPRASSLLCRDICLHHSNVSTDSPNQYVHGYWDICLHHSSVSISSPNQYVHGCKDICLHHSNVSTDNPNQYVHGCPCFCEIGPSALCPSSKAQIPPLSLSLPTGLSSSPSSLVPMAPIVNFWQLRPIPPKSQKFSQKLDERGKGHGLWN